MINPKYDPSNYLKHIAVAVITDKQKINQLFGSYLLRVRWWHDNPKMSPQSDLIGRLRVHMDTPFGAVEPRDYQFKISSHKQIYVQFLTIPIPEFEYKIEVIHPVGLTRSKIELWEYITPLTYNTSSSNMSNQSNPTNTSDPAMIAALNAVANSSAATVNAVNASNTNTINYLSTQVEVALGAPTFVAANNVNRICLADANAREYTISNNNANGSLKLRVAPLPDGTAYTAITSELGNPIPPGGNFVVSDPLCRGEIYAVGSIASMLVTVVKAAKTNPPAPLNP